MFFPASVHLIVDEATLAENHRHLFLPTDSITFIPDILISNWVYKKYFLRFMKTILNYQETSLWYFIATKVFRCKNSHQAYLG